MAGTSTAFANRGKLYYDTGGNVAAPATEIAIVKDVEITTSAEHVPLYGWGSIARQAVAKHSLKIAVKIGFVKWNPAIVSGAGATLPFGIYGATPGYSINDTNTVNLYSIKATFTFEDGQVLTGVIHNVFFPDFPIKASEGQWVRLDLSGEGASADWTLA
jgi:hypothetical protein